MQIVTTHKNTDFDGLASVIAATLIYPGCIAVLPKALNPNVRAFVSLHKDLFQAATPSEIDLDAVERLVVVDCASWGRLEGLDRLQSRGGLEIELWDHHAISGEIAAARAFVEPMGATVTLMARRLKELGTAISPIQATLFLMGIYEDTGSLTFPSTRPEDLFAAGYLMQCQADLNVLGSFLRPAYAPKQKDVLFEMIKNEKRLRLNGHTVSISRLAIDGHVEGLALVVRMFRDIVNADAVFGIFSRQDQGHSRCMVIGRSGVEAIDVGQIMHRLGGGGHPGAGSALLKSVNPEVVEEMILELICGNCQASVRVIDLMSYPVTTVDPETPMSQVADLLEAKGHSGLPVVDGRHRLLGILSRRDFRKLRKDSQLQAPAKAFMQAEVKTIDADQSPLQAARLMIRHDIGRLPVMNDGRMIGIVTRSDVMMYFYDMLPE
jgi:nanoRNase/pAp phosphatase (c-di-AMP/oligoRNAs hydrolase)